MRRKTWGIAAVALGALEELALVAEVVAVVAVGVCSRLV